MRKSKYSDQVFVNCPFDDKYFGLFFSIVFTVLDCGFIPRCSKEVDDATQFRLRSIVDLIGKCKYGIHDLSRVQLDKRYKLPRFNMPFELGIFYGAKSFGPDNQMKKNCVVLERYPYRYQKYISDISGIDVKNHNNSMEKCVEAIRNWLTTASRRITIPEFEIIYSRYLEFRRDFDKACKSRSVNFQKMPFVEFTRNISDWLKINQKVHRPLFSK